MRGACRRFFLLASGTRLAPALVMAAYGAPLNPAQPVRAHVVRDGADSAGLSEAEARGRLERDGPNELTARGTPHPIVRFVKKLFASPLVVVLLLACIGSAALGDVQNAAIIAAIVAVSSVVELVQTRRSEKAAAHLRCRVAQTATAVRDGHRREVPRSGDRAR